MLLGLLACAPLLAAAQSAPGLDVEQAQALALERAPMLAARRAGLEAAQQLRISAGELPDPELSLALEALPISGPMRWSTTAEPMTQRTLGWMQSMPNAAKRAAQVQAAQARSEREAAMLQVERLAVQREVTQAWLARWYAERRLAVFGRLEDENRLLRDTVNARVAAGSAMPAEATMAQQEALMLADRRDTLQRDLALAQAGLRRWLGEDAARPLQGEPPRLSAEREPLLQDIPQHADLVAFDPMQRMNDAEIAEAQAMKRGDWSWQIMYSRRASTWGDLVGFQLNFELPLWAATRQDPQIAARRKASERIAAEREDMQRLRRQEIDMQLAELEEASRMATRLREGVAPLVEQRLALAMAAYEAARGGLAEVLAARRERAEIGLRALELEARQHNLRAALNYLIVEAR